MMKTTVAVAGVFAVLLYSQSAAGAPKSSDAKNSGKSAATAAEKDYIGSKDAKFSKQDAALKQAESLVKQEKFELLTSTNVSRASWKMKPDGRPDSVSKRSAAV